MGLAVLILSIYLGYDILTSRQETINNAMNAARQEAVNAAGKISTEMNRFVPLIEHLADELSSGTLIYTGLMKRMEDMMRKHPRLFAIGAAFEPFAYDHGRRLYGPYLMRKGEEVARLQVEDFYDYTESQYKWYSDPIRKGPGWDEPVWGEASGALMATYSAPFYRTDGQGGKVPAGLVYFSFSIELINRWVRELYLGKTGWGIAFSKEGVLLAHPIEETLQKRYNVHEYAEETGDQVLKAAAGKMSDGKSGSFPFLSPETGLEVLIFYEPIKGPGWSMGVVLVKEEIPSNDLLFRRKIIRLLILSIFSLMCLAVRLSAGFYKNQPHVTLWCLVAFLSLLLTAGIDVIRHLTFVPLNRHNAGTTMITDRNGLNVFLGGVKEDKNAQHREPPIFVPAGIFVQSIEFTSPSNLFLKGFMWQKITDELHSDLTEGFVMPDGTGIQLSEAFRRKEGNVETVGWDFEVTLRQDMDYSRFPFDHDTVWIRLWHKDFDRNVMLVPDLEAYSLMNPVSRPGLEEDLTLPGWVIKGSFFTYRPENYNTNFGIPGYLGKEASPELYFNIVLERGILNAIVSHIIPLLIVSILLFAVLAAATKDAAKAKEIGFNPSSVLRLTSALFFVVLLAHIQLRNTIKVQEVLYLEYFYFSMYLLIMLVSLHSFLFTNKQLHIRFLDYENSLVPKLLFWPILLGLQFGITVLVFY